MQSYLKTSSMNTPLSSTSAIKPKGRGLKKALAAGLLLTSLVDAFTILVIYLLVNTTGGGQQLRIENNITLPLANHSDILQAGVLVTTIKEGYKVNEDVVSQESLFETLKNLHTSLKDQNDERATRLVIQADKTSSFEYINPIILAGTQSGFETIKFAVLPVEAQ
jgi:biopolymer transport protein ExbD